MRFYHTTTQFNRGIDLRARQMYVCVVDRLIWRHAELLQRLHHFQLAEGHEPVPRSSSRNRNPWESAPSRPTPNATTASTVLIPPAIHGIDRTNATAQRKAQPRWAKGVRTSERRFPGVGWADLILPPKAAPRHTLRHRFATLLLEVGHDIRTAPHLIGRQDVATTQVYRHALS